MRLPDKGKSDDTIPYSPLFVRNSGQNNGNNENNNRPDATGFQPRKRIWAEPWWRRPARNQNGNRKRVQTSGSRGNVRTMIKAACFTAITAVKDGVNKRRTARLCDETTYLDRCWPTGRLFPRDVHRCLLFHDDWCAPQPHSSNILTENKGLIRLFKDTNFLFRDWFTTSFISYEK